MKPVWVIDLKDNASVGSHTYAWIGLAMLYSLKNHDTNYVRSISTDVNSAGAAAMMVLHWLLRRHHHPSSQKNSGY